MEVLRQLKCSKCQVPTTTTVPTVRALGTPTHDGLKHDAKCLDAEHDVTATNDATWNADGRTRSNGPTHAVIDGRLRICGQAITYFIEKVQGPLSRIHVSRFIPLLYFDVLFHFTARSHLRTSCTIGVLFVAIHLLLS